MDSHKLISIPREVIAEKTLQHLYPPLLNKCTEKQRLRMTDIGLYSITPYKEADQITEQLIERLSRLQFSASQCVVADVTAGLGGNTLSFAKRFRQVIAIEKDKLHYDILCHNLREVYRVQNVEYYSGDGIATLQQLRNIDKDIDVLWVDPPWGGPEYKHMARIQLWINDDLIEHCISMYWITRYTMIAMKVPFNYDLASCRNYLESQHTSLHIDVVPIKNYMIVYIWRDDSS